MQKYITVLKLFLKTNNKVVLYIFISLVIILSLSFFTLFTIQSLVDSYKNRFFNSYTGVFGTVWVKVENPKGIKILLKNIKYPYVLYNRFNYKLIFIDGNNSITKNIKIFLWNKNSAVNETFNRIMGHRFVIKNLDRVLKTEYNVIDTGFLYVQPMLFLNKKDLKILNIHKEYNTVSFYVPVDVKAIASVKKKITKLLNRYQIPYNTPKDFLSQNSEMLEKLKNIELFRKILFYLTTGISIIILIFSLILFSTVKKEAIKVLYYFGFSNFELNLFFTAITEIVLISAFCLGYILFKIAGIYLNKIIRLVDISYFQYIVSIFITGFVLFFILFLFIIRREK